MIKYRKVSLQTLIETYKHSNVIKVFELGKIIYDGSVNRLPYKIMKDDTYVIHFCRDNDNCLFASVIRNCTNKVDIINTIIRITKGYEDCKSKLYTMHNDELISILSAVYRDRKEAIYEQRIR